jgi:hypothetical protein
MKRLHKKPEYHIHVRGYFCKTYQNVCFVLVRITLTKLKSTSHDCFQSVDLLSFYVEGVLFFGVLNKTDFHDIVEILFIVALNYNILSVCKLVLKMYVMVKALL